MRSFFHLRRLYYTIRPLRLKQVWYRLKYRFFPLRSVSSVAEPPALNRWYWRGIEVIAPSILGPNHVRFLNLEGKISSPVDWNNSKFEKLWLYNLHYFDDLNALDNSLRKNDQLNLVLRWIAENPPCSGNGWEPYTLSLRLVNWVKWYSRAEIQNEHIIRSIAQQADALRKQLEYHILGNHLFANAKALVFVGCFLQGREAQRCLKLGLKILETEVSEQFLADGGHFELSPMYHSILLWDLLDLINLADTAANKELSEVSAYWRETALRALRWLKVMEHPDGEISFFNDSAMEITALPAQLFSYAISLKLLIDNSGLPELVTLPASGYSRITMQDHCLFFDHADVGPAYLPGHAHADTLSVEWSVGSERVLVNSGTSIYGVSQERLRQRQTAAHNTVVVDNTDSSEVWSGFRVAQRAYATLIESRLIEDQVVLAASHNGYKRLSGKVTHQRKIVSSARNVEIYDCLLGKFNRATVHWHLCPSIKVDQVSTMELKLTLSSGRYIYLSSNVPLTVMPSSWHPRFGETISSVKVTADFISNIVHTCLTIK